MKFSISKLSDKKALVVASIAFFLVSLFTVNLILNLNKNTTNTSTEAVMCGSSNNINSCQLLAGCKWEPDTCNSLSSIQSPPSSDWTAETIVDKNLACINDAGCRISTTSCADEPKESVSIINCSTQTQIDFCYGNSRFSTNPDRYSCRWFFSCVAKSGFDGTRKDPYAGRCVQDTTSTPAPSSQPPPTTPGGPTAPIPPPSTTSCACGAEPFTNGTADKSDDNFCIGYPGTRNTCLEANDGPDGYCDWDADGIVDSGPRPPGIPGGEKQDLNGWGWGWTAYEVNCGHGGGLGSPPSNPPPPGAQPTSAVPPTTAVPPTVVPDPTAEMSHACSENYSETPDASPRNTEPSYDITLENINPVSYFQQANFQFCMNPGKNQSHGYIYVHFFQEKAPYKSSTSSQIDINRKTHPDEVDNRTLPDWACYSVGIFTAIPPSEDASSIKFTINSQTKLPLLSINHPITGTPNYNPSLKDIAKFTDDHINDDNEFPFEPSMSPETRYDLKAVLITNNGFGEPRVNDKIVSEQGHIQIQSNACTDEPINPGTPTPQPQACRYVTQLVDNTNYLADIDGHREFTQEFDLSSIPGLDYTMPIRVGADWGWTGNDQQLGPVTYINGESDEAGPQWQDNEQSDVTIKTVNMKGTIAEAGNIFCPDVGDFDPQNDVTLFSDGREINIPEMSYYSDLRDVSATNSADWGFWYTCPKNAGGTPLHSLNDGTRPEHDWIDLALTPNITKLELTKTYSGGKKSRGSHFVRLLVSYCRKEINSTAVPNPSL